MPNLKLSGKPKIKHMLSIKILWVLLFKDEESLEEWDLEFPNENMEELEELYLAICEMEYFPMECEMIGHKRKDVLENITTLIVSEFNILYIQGCGEE